MSCDSSIDVVVVVSAVVSSVVVVGVGVVGFWGAALFSMVLVFSVSGTGFGLSGWSFAGWARKGLSFLDCFFCPGRIEEEGAKEKDEGDYYRTGDYEGDQ